MRTGVEPEALELAIDVKLLDQALINLVRNALEALCDLPAGVIFLTAQRTEDRLVISVAGNGPGIAPEQREKMFVAFFTTRGHGSGVGLTRARQITATHGASVDVQHTPGGGATVRLLFGARTRGARRSVTALSAGGIGTPPATLRANRRPAALKVEPQGHASGHDRSASRRISSCIAGTMKQQSSAPARPRALRSAGAPTA